MLSPLTKHTGYNWYRVKDPMNKKELDFVAAWVEEHEHWDLLGYLLGDDNTPATYNVRDWKLAATIIQWLGTPVGQSFLRKVEEKHSD